MKRYDCYYTNDFGSDYSAFSKEAADGDWVSFEDHEAEVAQLRGTLSLAEEGLANYAQENGQFRKALEMIRDGSIPQAMSPALFAEFVLRGDVPQSAEHSPPGLDKA